MVLQVAQHDRFSPLFFQDIRRFTKFHGAVAQQVTRRANPLRQLLILAAHVFPFPARPGNDGKHFHGVQAKRAAGPRKVRDRDSDNQQHFFRTDLIRVIR